MGDEFLDGITIDKLTKGDIEEAAIRAHNEALFARTQHKSRVQAAEAVKSRSVKQRHLDAAEAMNRKARLFEILSEVAHAYANGELQKTEGQR